MHLFTSNYTWRYIKCIFFLELSKKQNSYLYFLHINLIFIHNIFNKFY